MRNFRGHLSVKSDHKITIFKSWFREILENCSSHFPHGEDFGPIEIFRSQSFIPSENLLSLSEEFNEIWARIFILFKNRICLVHLVAKRWRGKSRKESFRLDVINFGVRGFYSQVLTFDISEIINRCSSSNSPIAFTILTFDQTYYTEYSTIVDILKDTYIKYESYD